MPLPIQSLRRRHTALIGAGAVLIVLAGWFVFSPALRGGWLWDDDREITENLLLRDTGGLRLIWFAAASPDFFPLKSTVQWIEWRLWKNDPSGYHALSIILHLLSALLVWRLVRKLGVRFAWLGGLLFAIHPLTVESVAWISEQKNTLSLPPLLLAMCAWLDFDERKQWRDLVLAVILFAAAMLCKTSVVMFPLVLLLHAWWKRGKITSRDLVCSLPFFTVSLVLGLVTVWFQQHHAIGDWAIPVGGYLTRLARAGLALCFYLSKSIVPVRLLPMYPRWNVDPPAIVQFLPWLFIGGVASWLWAKRSVAWARHGLFGFGCFAVNLAPVLGFVAMAYMRYTWVADHFAYLSLVPITGLAAAGAATLYQRVAVEWRPVAIAAAGGLVLALVLASRGYAGVFQNEETLWRHTLQHNPQAWAAHHNLGTTLLRSSRWEQAAQHFERAAALKPDFADAQNNLGVALLHLNRAEEAWGHFQQALSLKPDYPEAHTNLGNRLARAGRLEEAVGHYVEALRIDPRFTDAQISWANALARAGRLPEAIEHHRQALRIAPDSAVAHYNFGTTLAEHGRPQEAAEHYTEALRLKPDYAEAHNNLGGILLETGQLSDAVAHFERALQLNPALAEAHANRGNALLQLGRTQEAIQEYERALQLDPHLTDAADNLRQAREHAGP
jgi:tetratricopeptide (TPR) repeat protein